MREIVYLSLMFINWFFPVVSKKITMSYWMTSDKVHRDTSWKTYNFYYSRIKGMMKPKKDDHILDAGCGTGEITYLFHKDGYRIKGFDMSDYLVCRAKLRFPGIHFYVDDLVDMSSEEGGFTKIFSNNCIYYIHPKFLKRASKNLSSLLCNGGELYILDWADFSKRKRNMGGMIHLLTYFLPVYQPSLGGFWYKREWIREAAYEAGFKKVEFLNSWVNYRSHAILKK